MYLRFNRIHQVRPLQICTKFVCQTYHNQPLHHHKIEKICMTIFMLLEKGEVDFIFFLHACARAVTILSNQRHSKSRLKLFAQSVCCRMIQKSGHQFEPWLIQLTLNKEIDPFEIDWIADKVQMNECHNCIRSANNGRILVRILIAKVFFFTLNTVKTRPNSIN